MYEVACAPPPQVILHESFQDLKILFLALLSVTLRAEPSVPLQRVATLATELVGIRGDMARASHFGDDVGFHLSELGIRNGTGILKVHELRNLLAGIRRRTTAPTARRSARRGSN